MADWKFQQVDENDNPINVPEVHEEEQAQEQEQEEQQEEQAQEQEQQVQEQQEDNPNDALAAEAQKLEEEQQLDDDKVMSYLRDKFNLEAESLENVLKKDEIPDEVSKYLEYKKETGRSFDDFLNLQKDWAKVSDTDVLREYYKNTKPHLDDNDISYLLEDNFSYDAELDDDREVKRKQVAFKDELYKARNHFEGQKEKYKSKLESSVDSIPDAYKEAYDFYNKQQEQDSSVKDLQEKQARFFAEKTNALFGEGFKGFEFDLGEGKAVFEVKDRDGIKSSQSDVMNFLNRHIGEDGFLKDPSQYHKEIFAATHADQIAKHFYNQGLADATKKLVKDTKNIDMDVRSTTNFDPRSPKFEVVNEEKSSSLKIKKRY